MRSILTSRLTHFLSIGLLAGAACIRAEVMPIDLPTALRLADAQNLGLAQAVETSRQAALAEQAAWARLLPTVRFGASRIAQDGLLQETSGAPLLADRNARQSGFGVSAIGAGLPARPGLELAIDLGDAILGPLAARQDRQATDALADAQKQASLYEVAAAYYELVRAHQQASLSFLAQGFAAELAQTAAAFAEAGEGRSADASRAQIESLLQSHQLAADRADVITASAQLASLLQLPGDIELVPQDEQITPLNLTATDENLETLLAQARAQAPSLLAAQAGARAAHEHQRIERLRPLLPKVAASYSRSEFNATRSGFPSLRDDRDDLSVAVFWELEGLGLGAFSQSRLAASKSRVAELAALQTTSDIEASVRASFAQLQATTTQMELVAQAAKHARSAFELELARLAANEGVPIEGLISIQTLAKVESLFLRTTIAHNLAQLRLQSLTGELSAR